MRRVSRALLGLTALCALALSSDAAKAKIEFSVAPGADQGTAQLSSGTLLEPNLERWLTGEYDGYAACLPVPDDTKGEPRCGCLDKQLSAIEAKRVTIAIVDVTSCAKSLIEGTWNSSWGQLLAAQAHVTFHYDDGSKRISGCWEEPGGAGAITGFISDGVLDVDGQKLTFNYRDTLRGTSGGATLTLFNTPYERRLLGNWRETGATSTSGSWKMTRDPVRKMLDCGEQKSSR